MIDLVGLVREVVKKFGYFTAPFTVGLIVKYPFFLQLPFSQRANFVFLSVIGWIL